jgi:hypothetical protein
VTISNISGLVFRSLLASTALLSPAGFAATYSESVDGELSGVTASPTFLQLDYLASGNVPGSNVVDGMIGRSASTGQIDLDYLWVNVPVGFILSELRVGNSTTFGNNGSFIGVASGSFMPVPPNTTTASGLLGWKVYGAGDRSTNILDDMALAGNGASGFSGLLGPGDYTFWIQELSTGSYNYRFNLVLTPEPVPVPAAVWLLGSGLGALSLLRHGGRSRTSAA